MTADLLSKLDAEEARLKAELARIEGELADIRTAREVCQRFAGFAPPAGPPPGKPEPRPASDGPGEADPTQARALRIARLMHAGKRGVLTLAKAIGVSEPTALLAIKGRPDWFEKHPPGAKGSPWVLTEAGRLAAAAPPPGA